MRAKTKAKMTAAKTPEKPKRKYTRRKPMANVVKVKLQPYPTELDLTQFLSDAIAFFRGQGDKARIVHDAYEALGYGLGKYVPDEVTGENPIRFSSPQTFFALGNPEAAEFIDRALNHPDTGLRAAKPGTFDWHTLLSLAIQAALKIINQWLGFQ